MRAERRTGRMVALAGAAAGICLAGCANLPAPGGAVVGASNPAVNTITAAYERTSQASTARIHVAESVGYGTTSSAAQTIPLTADGVVDLTNQRIRATASIPQARLDLLMLGSVIYARPSIRGLSLPIGTSWLKIDLNALVGKRYGAGIATLGGTALSGNFAEILTYLGAGVDSATPVGTDQIHGARATHYKVVINLDALAASRTGVARTAITSLIGQVGSHRLPLDVWVDGQGRVTRVHEALSLALSGVGRVSLDTDVTLYDFGAPVQGLTAPPASQTLDITGQLTGKGAS